MKTTSTSGTGLGILAGIACAACCVLPVLIAAGVLSGAGAALLTGMMPVIAIALAVLAVGAIALASRRTTTGNGCGGSCSTEEACGCSPARG